MLNRHPEVAIPPESHFIPRLWDRRSHYGRGDRLERPRAFLRDLGADRRFRDWNVPIEDVAREIGSLPDPSFADGIAAAYRVYARSRGRSRWGDKTPRYVDRIPLLARLFPTARFVHVVRDGRDVALSMLDIGRLHRRSASPALVWRRQVARGRRAGRALGPDRYREIRYEALVEDPERELRALCGFLDLPFDPSVLRHDDRAPDRLPSRVRWMHTRLALPPTKGLRDWRRDMSARDVAEYEAIAGEQLVAMGYELSGTPSPWTRMTAWTRLVPFAGRALRQRLRSRTVIGLRRRRDRKNVPE